MHCFVEIVIPTDSSDGLTCPTEQAEWVATPRGMEMYFFDDSEPALSWVRLFCAEHPDTIFRISHITYLNTAEIFSNDLTGEIFSETFGFLDLDTIVYQPTWEEAREYINEGNRLLGLPENEMLAPDDEDCCPRISVQRVSSINGVIFKQPIGYQQ